MRAVIGWILYALVMCWLARAIWRQTGVANAAQEELERRRRAWDHEGHWP